MEKRVDIANLRHRQAYKVDARDFTAGVWDAHTNSFHGMSLSYGTPYVQQEYEETIQVRPTRYGSAWAETELPMVLPDTILLPDWKETTDRNLSLLLFLVELEALLDPEKAELYRNKLLT
jgi:hypothetical protein